MNSHDIKLAESEMAGNCTVICPFLGLDIDPHTSIAYPSLGNACHRTKKTQLVSQLHQGQFCLAEAFDSCPTFRQIDIPVADVDIAPVKSSYLYTRHPLKMALAIALLLIIFVAAFTLFPRFSPQKVDASPVIEVSSSSVEIEQEGIDNAQPTPTLITREQLPLAKLPQNKVTTTAVATISSKSTQTTTTSVATATAVVEPTNTTQPKATKPAAATATPEPQPTVAVDTEQTENSAAFDDNINYTYGTGVIDTGKLNVRRGPGPQFNTISTVSKGQIITLTGRNGDSSWARVRLGNGVVGWVYAEFVVAEPPLERLPFIPRTQR